MHLINSKVKFSSKKTLKNHYPNSTSKKRRLPDTNRNKEGKNHYIEEYNERGNDRTLYLCWS